MLGSDKRCHCMGIPDAIRGDRYAVARLCSRDKSYRASSKRRRHRLLQARQHGFGRCHDRAERFCSRCRLQNALFCRSTRSKTRSRYCTPKPRSLRSIRREYPKRRRCTLYRCNRFDSALARARFVRSHFAKNARRNGRNRSSWIICA